MADEIAFKRSKRPAGGAVRSRTAAEDAPAVSEEQSESVTVSDLLALRKLRQLEQREAAGIEAAKLNAGSSANKKRKMEHVVSPPVQTHGLQPSLHGDDSNGAGLAKRIAQRGTNFTQQTNVVDVDKHMLSFIEAELRKRRAAAGLPNDDYDANQAAKALDPRDELYLVAEKYREKPNPLADGTVTMSAALLTAIPEVDLGIETRLRNIEETEKAKRKLFEQQQKAEALRQNTSKEVLDANNFAAERFHQPVHISQPQPSRSDIKIDLSDADLLRLARESAARGDIDGWEDVARSSSAGAAHVRQKASDEILMQRYRARAAQNNARSRTIVHAR